MAPLFYPLSGQEQASGAWLSTKSCVLSSAVIWRPRLALGIPFLLLRDREKPSARLRFVSLLSSGISLYLCEEQLHR